MNLLTVPYPLLADAARRLLRNSGAVIRWTAGTSRWGGHHEWLARAGDGGGVTVLVGLITGGGFSDLVPPADCSVAIAIGAGLWRGRIGGVCRVDGVIEPLDVIRIVGRGIHTIGTVGGRGPRAGVLPDRGRWSRTIGALGEQTWERMTDLSVGIVGLGRTGPVVADALARLGVRRFTLVDPDFVEPHNLGEMALVTDRDVGMPKVEAMAAALTARGLPRESVVAVQESITSTMALRAVQACDIIVSAVDHDAARLACTVIGTLFHRPLLDVATGVLAEAGQRRLGADVRLVTGRCLLCTGGLTAEAAARNVLSSADAEQAFYDARDWRSERAGSLASLNLLAASLALRLLEDWMAGRTLASVWLHVEYDEAGQAAITYPPTEAPRVPCRLCALAGMGERGLLDARQVIAP